MRLAGARTLLDVFGVLESEGNPILAWHLNFARLFLAFADFGRDGHWRRRLLEAGCGRVCAIWSRLAWICLRKPSVFVAFGWLGSSCAKASSSQWGVLCHAGCVNRGTVSLKRPTVTAGNLSWSSGVEVPWMAGWECSPPKCQREKCRKAISLLWWFWHFGLLEEFLLGKGWGGQCHVPWVGQARASIAEHRCCYWPLVHFCSNSVRHAHGRVFLCNFLRAGCKKSITCRLHRMTLLNPSSNEWHDVMSNLTTSSLHALRVLCIEWGK